MTTQNAHRWKFFRAGRLDQVLIRDGRDIARLHELDQKLWVALSCATRGVEFDTKTLDLIDTDKDGRIRVPELLKATQWTTENLKNPDDLLKADAALPLSAINDQTDSGAKLLAGARRILANLGKSDATAITLTDTADTARIFAQTKFNGDGIIPADSAADAETQKVIEDIIACLGSEADRSGKPGVNEPKLKAFFEQARTYSDWWAKSEGDKALRPLGEATAVAHNSMRVVRAKVDDYFARCLVAAFDARAAAPMNRADAEYVAIAMKDLTISSDEIARLPLARIEPGRPLSLTDGVNPAWAAAMEKFRTAAVVPLLGADKKSITQQEWGALNAKLAAYEAWFAAKPPGAVEKLGVERIRAILAGKAKENIAKLIQQDAALEPENAQINAVDKLIRFYRDLNRLLHNYVNLSDFYNPKLSAMFQIGRLYMDARSCDLCFDIADMNKHALLAAPSKIFLAYCEVTRPTTGQKKVICAAFTSGFAESLWVGRNGIFYDRQGNDWDAVIVKVVESPISLKEAFWSPWRKIAMMISEQMKKLLAAREAAAMAAASKSVDETGKQIDAGKPAPGPAPRADGAAMASSVAAIGIAVGLLGSAVAGMVSTVSGLPLWKSFLGVAGVILLVSGPSVILAYFRLRARDLGPILNACGWAVNTRIRMTMALGRKLTQEAALPEGSERQLTDPYADKTGTRNFLIGVVVVVLALWLLWWFDVFDPWLTGKFERFRHAPPAAAPVTPAQPPSVPPAEAPKAAP